MRDLEKRLTENFKNFDQVTTPSNIGDDKFPHQNGKKRCERRLEVPSKKTNNHCPLQCKRKSSRKKLVF